MLWSKYAAAKLREFIRRQRESKLELNVQLRSAVEWRDARRDPKALASTSGVVT